MATPTFGCGGALFGKTNPDYYLDNLSQPPYCCTIQRKSSEADHSQCNRVPKYRRRLVWWMPPAVGGLPFKSPSRATKVLMEPATAFYKIRLRVFDYCFVQQLDCRLQRHVTKGCRTADLFEELPYYQVDQATAIPKLYARVFSLNRYPSPPCRRVTVLARLSLDPKLNQPPQGLEFTCPWAAAASKLAPEFRFSKHARRRRAASTLFR